MRNNLMQKKISIISIDEEATGSVSRWLQVAPLAAIITLGLLVLMERLIAMADVVIDETETTVIQEVFWEEPIIETRKSVPPDKPKEIPDTPELPATVDKIDTTIEYSLPKTGHTVATSDTLKVSFGANVPIAQYLAAPRYPAAAVRREISGYVDVMFDVTAFGGTDNIRVIQAEPEGIFEKSATDAVARWRFQPKIYDDKPVRFDGMTRRVRFEMEK
ncbi:energy transducer TonB [Teredinibacter purpureus]|uniref:energy transducer TonB n=1 Tax=Teredinibacter purpureus TaxID=2731756 RepID=UPI000698AE66|nr:energy transducer TonB [Teredinibacter purpureus]